MAFCRFSDEDYGCDLYIYEDTDGGYVTHVASFRYDWKPPKPSPYDFDYMKKAHEKTWKAQLKKYHEKLKHARQVTIGLPFDGHTFWDEDVEEVIERVVLLHDLGYQVPEWVVTALKNEQEDIDRATEALETGQSPIWEL
ncbi:hypothetical protein JM93_03043 [Roseibium hamelinense]|uniref:Uncharacterized protein n=2 Tax=Roseibium hamelinense TaxID=150831 RepID=A0A562STN2_9HYPH|nr:hypothetical protein JM93_03043 [Roseibium hamelinense]